MDKGLGLVGTLYYSKSFPRIAFSVYNQGCFQGPDLKEPPSIYRVEAVTNALFPLYRGLSLFTTFLYMYRHTYRKSMDQPGKVANPVRGQLIRENEYFPVRVRENLVSRDGFGIPVPHQPAHLHTQAGSVAYGIPPEFRGGVHLFKTAIRHRVSPEFIGPRNCVPTAFTAESSPAQGQ